MNEDFNLLLLNSAYIKHKYLILYIYFLCYNRINKKPHSFDFALLISDTVAFMLPRVSITSSSVESFVHYLFVFKFILQSLFCAHPSRRTRTDGHGGHITYKMNHPPSPIHHHPIALFGNIYINKISETFGSIPGRTYIGPDNNGIGTWFA